MTSLESIVLPLAESRALVEHGIVLDTVASWITDGATHSRPVIIEPAVYEAVKSRIICPAPVLSELLDAIRARVGDAEFHSYNVNTVIDIGTRTWELLGDYNDEVGVRGFYRTVERAQAPTDLLAAAALLMEVSK